MGSARKGMGEDNCERAGDTAVPAVLGSVSTRALKRKGVAMVTAFPASMRRMERMTRHRMLRACCLAPPLLLVPSNNCGLFISIALES